MITAGWVLFVVWSVVQFVWYRRAHVDTEAQPAVRPAPVRGAAVGGGLLGLS